MGQDFVVNRKLEIVEDFSFVAMNVILLNNYLNLNFQYPAIYYSFKSKNCCFLNHFQNPTSKTT